MKIFFMGFHGNAIEAKLPVVMYYVQLSLIC